MSGKPVTNEGSATAPGCVDDAVGVPGLKWFVAIVNNRSEKAVQKKLLELGYEAYVASQTVIRVWKNGRKATVDKVLMPSVVFVRCTEMQRRRHIVNLPFVNRFMTDRAAAYPGTGRRPPAVIPQQQMDRLRFMLGQSDIPVGFDDRHYSPHDRIRIVRGRLQGLEGEVVKENDGRSEIIVRVDLLGCAILQIDTADIEPAI